MDNRTCQVVMLLQKDQSKHPEVNTICHNVFYDYFMWTKKHNDNGSRTGSQEYKERSMKQWHVYFTFHHCPISDGCVVYYAKGGKIGKVTKIHPNADLTVKFGKEDKEIISIHEVVPVIASSDKILNVATIPLDFITAVLLPAKGKVAEVMVDMDTYNNGKDITILSARMSGAAPRPNGNSGKDRFGFQHQLSGFMEVSAKELQSAKIEAELKIIEILQNFNTLCVFNDFQLESIQVTTQDTDQNRRFDVDLSIV